MTNLTHLCDTSLKATLNAAQERIKFLEAELAREKEIGFATSAELEACRGELAAKDGEIAEKIERQKRTEELLAAASDRLSLSKIPTEVLGQKCCGLCLQPLGIEAQLAQAQEALIAANTRHEQVVEGLKKEIALTISPPEQT